MASMIENGLALWMWPFGAAKLAVNWAETLSSAQRVIAARTPMIGRAIANPATADRRELSRMVGEKAAAFGKSGRSIAVAQGTIRQAFAANARALRRMWGGEVLPLAEWIGMFERNLEIAAALAGMPAGALAPVHATATANARRLG